MIIDLNPKGCGEIVSTHLRVTVPKFWDAIGTESLWGVSVKPKAADAAQVANDGEYPSVGSSKIANIKLNGQVAEWSKAADCKSAGVAYGGSNPSLPTSFCDKE